MGCNCGGQRTPAQLDAERRASAQRAGQQPPPPPRPMTDPVVPAAPPPQPRPQAGATQSFALIAEKGQRLEAEAARVRARRSGG